MPLIDHLIELRNRLMWAAGAVIVAFLVCYQFSEYIYRFLAQPLANIYAGQTGRQMIFTGLTEAFFTYIKVSFWAAICVSFPDHRDTDLEIRRAGPLQERAARVSAVHVRDAGAVPCRGGAGLFRRDPGRVPVLCQFRDAGDRRLAADRRRAEGQRISLSGDDAAVRVRRGVSACRYC